MEGNNTMQAISDSDIVEILNSITNNTLETTPNNEHTSTIELRGEDAVINGIHELDGAGIEEAGEEGLLKALPTNPITADEYIARYSNAPWLEIAKSDIITIAGIGGIGSHTTFLLSRTGGNHLRLYDSDIIESHNLSGQLFSKDLVGTHKVYAMTNFIRKFSNTYNYTANISNFTKDSPIDKIAICGFDNMESRKIFYKSWKKHKQQETPESQKGCLFIDGRLTADEFQIYCIVGNDTYNMKRYEEEFLFDSSEVENLPCSFKQTTYLASMIGSFITNLYINHCMNRVDGSKEIPLPFITKYDANSMFLKTEI